MEKKGVLIPLLFAAGAALIYFLVLTSKERDVNSAYEMGQVLVARYDIPERTMLKENMVETMPVPRKFMEQDAFEVKTPSDIKMIDNLVTKIRIPKGNQISQSAVSVLSPQAGLSVKIPPGYRGAILPIEPELKSLIKPGDRVDILVTFEALMAADNHKERVTATILQDILVLAVGNNMGQGLSAQDVKKMGTDEDRASTLSEKAVVSVALNPNEAQYLSLARKEGDVSIILRGQGDVELHPMEMASFRRLFTH